MFTLFTPNVEGSREERASQLSNQCGRVWPGRKKKLRVEARLHGRVRLLYTEIFGTVEPYCEPFFVFCSGLLRFLWLPPVYSVGGSCIGPCQSWRAPQHCQDFRKTSLSSAIAGAFRTFARAPSKIWQRHKAT